METANAKTMGATTTTLQTCHLAMLQEPAKVVEMIDSAAKNALKK